MSLNSTVSAPDMFCELDLKSLWKELDEYDIEIETETKKLQEVWVKIAELKEENETTTIGYATITFPNRHCHIDGPLSHS